MAERSQRRGDGSPSFFLAEVASVIQAFDLAAELDQPTIYDTLYLAVAEREHCDLWTADARFVRTARSRYPYVQSVASGQASS